MTRQLLIVLHQDQLLVNCSDGQSCLPEIQHFPALNVGDCIRLGEFNDAQCWMHCGDVSAALPENCSYWPLRKAMDTLGVRWFNALSRAHHLAQWQAQAQYCGRCGAATRRECNLLTRYCAACELPIFAKISPSIIVLIKKHQQILMARQPHFPPGVFGLIAGFVEPGESIEDAAHREVKEEVGLEIHNLRYFGSQPWPFPDSLMLAFTAEHKAGEIELVDGELEHAGWYSLDALPGMPSSSISIAKRLIESCFHCE